METNAVLDSIRMRRTVRRFKSDPVSDEQVKKLLLAAMSAPSALNRRPWHFLVIRDAATKKLVADTVRLHPYVEQAPVLIAALADVSLSPSWKLDMTAAMENLMLAAQSRGLGGAWIGEPETVLQQFAEDLLREKCGLPANVKLFSFAAVGYPDGVPAPHEPDTQFAETHVHYGTWARLKLGGVWSEEKH
jgi:nitroreductase